MKKLVLSALAGLALVAGLTGCTDAETTTAPAPPPAVAEAEPEGDAPLPEDAYEAPEPEQPAMGTFGGDGFKFDDGVVVGISEGTEFTPSEWAAADEAPHYLRFTVTLKNGSATPFDASSFMTAVSSGGVEFYEVYDDGVGETPSVPVLAGKTVSFDIAYPVYDPADVLMAVNVDFEHTEVLFTN